MKRENTKTFLCLSRWHQGDREELEALLKCHLPWICAHVRRRIGPLLRRKGETSDYVQDALIQFLQYSPRFILSNEAAFRALLMRIVENTLRDKHDWFTARRRAIAQERPLPSDTVLLLDPPHGAVDTPSKSAERHEQEAWIRLGIEFLDPEDRELLVLRHWDNLSFIEIGERFGITSNAAWKKHNRAICRLGENVCVLRQGKLDTILEEHPPS